MVERDLEAVGCLGVVWVGFCDDLLYGVWGLSGRSNLVVSSLLWVGG
jgi:hypothetical protein